jgi:hypothetical protein
MKGVEAAVRQVKIKKAASRFRATVFDDISRILIPSPLTTDLALPSDKSIA